MRDAILCLNGNLHRIDIAFVLEPAVLMIRRKARRDLLPHRRVIRRVGGLPPFKCHSLGCLKRAPRVVG